MGGEEEEEEKDNTDVSVGRPSRALALEADKEGLQAPDKAGRPKASMGRREMEGPGRGPRTGSRRASKSKVKRVQQGQTGAGSGPIYGTWAVGWRRDAWCWYGRPFWGGGRGQGSDEGQALCGGPGTTRVP